MSSAIRRRSSSSATIVTAWCSVSRSNSRQRAVVLGGHQPRLRRARLVAAAGAGDGQRERAALQLAAGGEAAARAARGRARAARRRARRRDRAARRAARGEHLAAPVEHHRRRRRSARRARPPRRRAPARRARSARAARARRARGAARAYCSLTRWRERLLGERDERQLVGHLEQREAVLLGGRLTSASGIVSCAKPVPRPSPASPWRGEPRDVLALPVGVGRAASRW